MYRFLTTCLIVPLWAGCSPFETAPGMVDGGFAGRIIAGRVTSTSGQPVPDVRVIGSHMRLRESSCEEFVLPGLRDRVTGTDGRYSLHIGELVHTSGEGYRCLVLEFRPPEESGLLPVISDTMRVWVYEDRREVERDTLFVDMILDTDPCTG